MAVVAVELIPAQVIYVDGQRVVIRGFTDDDLEQWRASGEDVGRQWVIISLIQEPVDLDAALISTVIETWLDRTAEIYPMGLGTFDLSGPKH